MPLFNACSLALRHMIRRAERLDRVAPNQSRASLLDSQDHTQVLIHNTYVLCSSDGQDLHLNTRCAGVSACLPTVIYHSWKIRFDSDSNENQFFILIFFVKVNFVYTISISNCVNSEMQYSGIHLILFFTKSCLVVSPCRTL